jgi:hypothetical protein
MFRAPLFQAQDIAMNSEEAGYQGIKQIVAKFGLSSSGVALRCGQHMVHHRAMCAYLRGSIGCTAKIAQSHCAVRFSQSVIGGHRDETRGSAGVIARRPFSDAHDPGKVADDRRVDAVAAVANTQP